MLRSLTIASLLLVAGCGQQPESKTDANEPAKAPAAEAPAPTPVLEGAWQVTKIDGSPMEAPTAATFASGKLRVAAGCNGRGWTYTQKKNIVSFATNPNGSSNCGDLPNVDQERAFQAIERATIAIFDKSGGEVTLSGDGGNVSLARR